MASKKEEISIPNWAKFAYEQIAHLSSQSSSEAAASAFKLIANAKEFFERKDFASFEQLISTPPLQTILFPYRALYEDLKKCLIDANGILKNLQDMDINQLFTLIEANLSHVNFIKGYLKSLLPPTLQPLMDWDFIKFAKDMKANIQAQNIDGIVKLLIDNQAQILSLIPYKDKIQQILPVKLLQDLVTDRNRYLKIATHLTNYPALREMIIPYVPKIDRYLAIANGVNTVIEGIKGVFRTIATAANAVYRGIVKGLSTIGNGIINLFSSVFSKKAESSKHEEKTKEEKVKQESPEHEQLLSRIKALEAQLAKYRGKSDDRNPTFLPSNPDSEKKEPSLPVARPVSPAFNSETGSTPKSDRQTPQ